MPLVFDTTPGGPSANAYASVAEADAYHDGMPASYATVWLSASNADKQGALVLAARVLDESFTWVEYRTSSLQAMEWPRNGVVGADKLSVIGSGVVPRQIKDANAELARQLLASDRLSDMAVDVQGLKSLTAGPVSLSFKDGVQSKPIPDRVWKMVPKWWYRGGLRSGSVPIARA